MEERREFDDGKLAQIRNADGLWINSQVFREEGVHYMKYGYYCPDPINTPSWMDYWGEQRKRCIHGHEVGGVRITGDHYFYLNFCPMKKAEIIGGRVAEKIVGFPDFWDGDYSYFWARDIARKGVFDLEKDMEIRKTLYDMEDKDRKPLLKSLLKDLQLTIDISDDHLVGGFNMIVGKSRRRGFTYKAGAVGGNNFLNRPKSLTIYGAYDSKFLYPGKGTIFVITNDNIGFSNANAAWAAPSDFVNQPAKGLKKNSYSETVNGLVMEKGLESEIMSLSFKDKADAARGKDAYDVFFEESGAFGTPGLLKKSYAATEDCVKAGVVKTGLITVFGTSGDMESGTADYADMFTRPKSFDFLPVINMWDKGSSGTFCGYFHPASLNLEGFYDEQGNSDYDGAKHAILKEREQRISGGASSTDIQKMMAEKPLSPSEAFASASFNAFPSAELNQQLLKVRTKNLNVIKGTPVELVYKGNGVEAKTLLHGKAEPIMSYNNLPESQKGCVMIYEPVISNPPKGLYKIGYDPVRQDEGTSLASYVVYKGVDRGSLNHNIIVAEYIGRLESTDDIDRIGEKLAIYYNTQVMHENEVTGVKNFFRRIKRLDLLAAQPNNVIDKAIKKSKVSRVYGCHMNQQLKDAGERYVKDWLLTVLDYDEEGNPIRALDRIYSVRMLEELLAYNRKGNFDIVSALFMCMFQVQEESLDKEYNTTDRITNSKKLVNMIGNMYKKH